MGLVGRKEPKLRSSQGFSNFPPHCIVKTLCAALANQITTFCIVCGFLGIFFPASVHFRLASRSNGWLKREEKRRRNKVSRIMLNAFLLNCNKLKSSTNGAHRCQYKKGSVSFNFNKIQNSYVNLLRQTDES